MTWYSNVNRELFEAFTETLFSVIAFAFIGYVISLFIILRLEEFLIKKIPILNKYLSDEKDFSSDDPLEFVKELKRLELSNLAFHTIMVLASIYAFGLFTYWSNYENEFVWDNVSTLSFFIGCYGLHIQIALANYKKRKYWRDRNFER